MKPNWIMLDPDLIGTPAAKPDLPDETLVHVLIQYQDPEDENIGNALPIKSWEWESLIGYIISDEQPEKF